MRDINRIEVICEELKKAWTERPDLRLGQLLLACGIFPDIHGERMSNIIFNQEDDLTLEILTVLNSGPDINRCHLPLYQGH
jgi:hypothetical protein